MTVLPALGYGVESRLEPAPDADVFLALHHDDIAFSLGSYVARNRNGRLHTVFARSSVLLDNYERFPLESASDAKRVDLISALRRKEDLAFAERVAPRATYADCEEAPVRGLDPFAR